MQIHHILTKMRENLPWIQENMSDYQRNRTRGFQRILAETLTRDSKSTMTAERFHQLLLAKYEVCGEQSSVQEDTIGVEAPSSKDQKATLYRSGFRQSALMYSIMALARHKRPELQQDMTDEVELVEAQAEAQSEADQSEHEAQAELAENHGQSPNGEISRADAQLPEAPLGQYTTLVQLASCAPGPPDTSKPASMLYEY
jgi:hypothetical protein